MHLRRAQAGRQPRRQGAARRRSTRRSPTRPASRARHPAGAQGRQGEGHRPTTSRAATGTVITIDRAHFKLRLFKRLKFVKSYGVAVGQPAYPTPTGLLLDPEQAGQPGLDGAELARGPASSPGTTTSRAAAPANPLKARWMGIVNGVGIHGTGEDWSIGAARRTAASACTSSDVIDLYPRVPVGTPVLIA